MRVIIKFFDGLLDVVDPRLVWRGRDGAFYYGLARVYQITNWQDTQRAGE